MKDNILGGLVIFVVVVTCLLMLDDISHSPQDNQVTVENLDEAQSLDNETQQDLAINDIED